MASALVAEFNYIIQTEFTHVFWIIINSFFKNIQGLLIKINRSIKIWVSKTKQKK